MKSRRLVKIESPYRGDIPLNIAYAKLAMLDSILRGEAPIATHLLYTEVLNDYDEVERALGISLGYEWLQASDLVAFYIDLGMSPGMQECHKLLVNATYRVPYENRRINPNDLAKLVHSGPDKPESV